MDQTSGYTPSQVGMLWVIPSGITMGYFAPLTIDAKMFVFYSFPLLCGYFFLGFRSGQLLQKMHLAPRAQSEEIQDAQIRYKYFFAMSLLIPLVLFGASPPPSADQLAELQINNPSTAQITIWNIRNIFSLVISALLVSILLRRLKKYIELIKEK